MVKKKKEDIQDIMDRIQEDLDTLRDRVIDLEDNQCQCDNDDEDLDDDIDDEDEDE
jgi:hypothetical protein